MKNKWWFFKDGFMRFMVDEFPSVMNSHFTYDLLENTIDKLLNLTNDKDEFVKWLYEIIPEVTSEEIEYWCNR